MKKDYIEEKLKEVIRLFVFDIRKELSNKYNVDFGDYYRFKGLCNEACELLNEKLNFNTIIERYNIMYGVYWPGSLSCQFLHGEQKHSPRIQTKYWSVQHTWLKITINYKYEKKYNFYVDPTMGQFKYLYNNIPDYWVSTKNPARYYYYQDRKNPAWHPFITRFINQNIKVPVEYNGEMHKEGIIEFIQYEIWGKISQFIYENFK